MTGADVQVRAGPRVCPDNLSVRFGSSYDAAIVYDASADELTLQTKDGSGSFVDRIAVRAGTNSPVAVFNDPGADMDVRMEGDTDPNLLFLDAGADRIGAGTAAPDTKLHVHAASAGSVSAPPNSLVTVENSGDAYLSFLSPNVNAQRIVFGDEADNDTAYVQYDHNSDQFGIFTNSSSRRLTITNAGKVMVGSGTSNGGASGASLTIDQGANDDEGLSLKSSDVAHGMTSIAETDTYGFVRKANSGGGGLELHGLQASGAVTPSAVCLRADYTAADTTKAAGAFAPVVIDARKRSGASSTVMGSNENILAVMNNTSCQFIVDGEGDTWQNGTLALQAVGPDPATITDAAHVYSKLVSGTAEVFVRDEAGNVTQVSPHDAATGEWVFSSENVRTGRALRIRVEALLKWLNEKFGLDMVEEFAAAN